MLLRLTRNVDHIECPWLNTNQIYKLNEGFPIYLFAGETYGCISESGAAVTFDPNGDNPFLEVPKDAIEFITYEDPG